VKNNILQTFPQALTTNSFQLKMDIYRLDIYRLDLMPFAKA